MSRRNASPSSPDLSGPIRVVTAILAIAGLIAGVAQGEPPAIAVTPAQAPAQPAQAHAITAVGAIGITVDDLDRSTRFYQDVLSFRHVSDIEVAGEPYEHLQGVFGLRMRIVTMALGDERIELTEYLVPKGRVIPPDSRSDDRWFQHMAIITNDMPRAYQRLRQHKVRHASTGPQLLPSWNGNAGGIQAFYFHDPDGHVLEVLQFPPDKGGPKWHDRSRSAPAHQLFLGIDHTAIVVEDTERSLALYRNLLGMEVAAESENYGTEQEHLNNVFGARLRITSIRPPNSDGPAIELLEYLAPRGGRPYPADARSNDLIHWQTTLMTDDLDRALEAIEARSVRWISSGTGATDMPDRTLGFTRAAPFRDPDGHSLRIIVP